MLFKELLFTKIHAYCNEFSLPFIFLLMCVCLCRVRRYFTKRYFCTDTNILKICLWLCLCVCVHYLWKNKIQTISVEEKEEQTHFKIIIFLGRRRHALQICTHYSRFRSTLRVLKYLHFVSYHLQQPFMWRDICMKIFNVYSLSFS